ASTGIAPALAGIVGGRPKASPVIKLFSFLIDKNQVSVEIDFEGKRYPVEIPQEVFTEQLPTLKAGENAIYQGDEIEVPLIEIAHARSGDK
ncbi:terpene utilization protein AtuA, partial [Acinetobacter junii]